MLVGNGGAMPPKVLRPIIEGIMRPWKGDRGLCSPPFALPVKRIPNPVKSLRILGRKDVAVVIMSGSLLYTVFSCINTSLSTTFIDIYHLKEWQAGLIYLPFGIGGIIASLISSRLIDRDYRIVARSHNLPIEKASGDELQNFPIEQARMRSVFAPILCASVSILLYGWLVREQIVSKHVEFMREE